jgi:hypothetical protein
LRKTDDGQRKSQQLERKLNDASRPIHGSGKLWKQPRRNELLQAQIPSTLRVDKERSQKRDQQQAPKPFWCAEAHLIANCQLKSDVEPPHSKARCARETIAR